MLYLFNEYAYPKNEFLHEEGRGFSIRKSRQEVFPFRESHLQNSTLSSNATKGNVASSDATVSRGYRLRRFLASAFSLELVPRPFSTLAGSDA